ncbi:MAG: cysteine synthase family protein [Acidimicrobiia bacterium]|nr:cysteine synthase family protein [Acidimicrobiia bacterium]MDH3396478.1 cysteine synthase family protein [Acidimicrobiia bacterium]MDH5616806.1 cysteine synthase family protein [Acidimicrobiia bacterium]
MKPGNTPLVELRNLAPSGTRLFAKLEWFNPTGSIKDRAAWYMFHNAVQTKKLHPGQTIVEATSGNTGIGLARLAQIYHHPMVICLPSAATEERRQLLRAYGAELIVVEGGPNDAIAHASGLVEAGEGHMLYQYGNRWNTYAHFFGTSQELLRDWQLETPPTHFLAAYGTGGTITGTSRGLKMIWADLRVHSVEPFVDDPISGMRSQDDPFQPPIADLSLVTDRHEVQRAVAESTVGMAMQEEGLFAGTSAGAILFAALEALSADGGTAVALLPDDGWKYLSGAPWTTA